MRLFGLAVILFQLDKAFAHLQSATDLGFDPYLDKNKEAALYLRL